MEEEKKINKIQEFIVDGNYYPIYDEEAVHNEEGGIDETPIFMNGITKFSKGLHLGGQGSTRIAIFYDKETGAITFGTQKFVPSIIDLDKFKVEAYALTFITEIEEGDKDNGDK